MWGLKAFEKKKKKRFLTNEFISVILLFYSFRIG